MGLRISPFKQQINITSANIDSNGAGSSIIFGFGNVPRTKFTLQVTGNDGSYVAAQAANFMNTGVKAGNPVTPTSWDVWVQAGVDLLPGTGSYAGGGSKILEHVSGTNNNGEQVGMEGSPMYNLLVQWSNVVLGSADNILVTITGDEL